MNRTLPDGISMSAWRAALVGMTARCDRHVDESDPLILMFCRDCQARTVKRAQEEYRRTREADR